MLTLVLLLEVLGLRQDFLKFILRSLVPSFRYIKKMCTGTTVVGERREEMRRHTILYADD